MHGRVVHNWAVRRLRFVTAHRGNLASFQETPLFKSVAGQHDLYACLNNRDGLPLVYNRFLNEDIDSFTQVGEFKPTHAPDDIVVFLHDDVELIAANAEQELNKWADEGFAIMGLVGSRHITVKEPTLWNTMSPPGAPSGVSVFHNAVHPPSGAPYPDPDQPRPANFGPLGEVIILDGVFMAVVKDLVDKASWRFDEAYDFHLYDLASCLNAHKAGLRLRTVFVPIVHYSPGIGDLSDPVFRKNQQTFLDAYQNRGR